MPASIIRTTNLDAKWIRELHTFLKSASIARRGILIDYVFEPPDQIVPQRLYRYDVFDDYISRHRDDFEFGFDLITAASLIPARRTFGVYVIELDGNSNHVYVGQTWYMPEERLAQHNTGFTAFHSARIFKSGVRGVLRPDLYENLTRVRTQKEAERLESSVAMKLRKLGFRVEGGH